MKLRPLALFLLLAKSFATLVAAGNAFVPIAQDTILPPDVKLELLYDEGEFM